MLYNFLLKFKYMILSAIVLLIKNVLDSKNDNSAFL